MNRREKQRRAVDVKIAADLLGDRWSLLILRNMVLRKVSSFTELLESGEGIASNMLSARLKKLLGKKIITVKPHHSDGRKLDYTLTAKGKALEPVLAGMVRWTARYLPRRTREERRRVSSDKPVTPIS